MDRIQQAIGTVENALLRLGHELASIWVLIQFGVILLAAAIATLAATLIRRRIDLAAHTMGWPPLLRQCDRGCSWPISARSSSCCCW